MTNVKTSTTTREQAMRVARQLGCSGAHQSHDGTWMPCEGMEEYQAVKKSKEEYLKVRASKKKKPSVKIAQRTERSNTKSRAYYENREDAIAVSKTRGCNGVRVIIIGGKKYYGACSPKQPSGRFEQLRERPIAGIGTMAGGGLFSVTSGAPGISMSSAETNGLESKGFVNFVSRSTDPDVYSNPESARVRARNMGCIGIRRYTSGDGKLVWLPCTNASDYNRASGIRGDNSPKKNPRKKGLEKSLTEWFKEEWVDISRPKKGGGFEQCGRSDANTGKYPKCVPKSRASRMTAEEIASAVSRKRRAESTQVREDKKPIYVPTDKKVDEFFELEEKSAIPTDPDLYARVKAEAKKKFDVYPSAYANAWLVREYKKRGGGYRAGKSKFGDFEEKLIDLTEIQLSDFVDWYDEKSSEPIRDPKGGLTAAGRRHFNQTEGSNLKPGVKGPANTPQKMRRKGSFLTRFFTNPSGPMKDENGKPTRLALSAAAWGEPVPQNMEDAARLAKKGRNLLKRYQNAKQKSLGADEIVEDSENAIAFGLINFKGVPKPKLAPPSVTSAEINNLAVKVRKHNAKGKPSFKTNLRDVKIVYIRGLEDGNKASAMKRVSDFLVLLADGKPNNVKYRDDNDLLPLDHPWRKHQNLTKTDGFDTGTVGLKYNNSCCPSLVKRYRKIDL